MLDEEDNIKEDGEDAKSELGWISEDQCPLVIIVRLEEHLEEAKAAPCKIQEHTTNAPALSAFVVEVHVGLGTDRSTHACDWYSKGDLLSLPTHVGTDRQTDAHACH